MEGNKLIEAYAVLLVLCTSLMVFGMFQMQAAVSMVMSQTTISPIQMILQGVQVSAIGLVLSAFIMVLFLRRLRAKRGAAEGKKAN